jgi:dephospho-CoA kinase
MKEKAAIVEPAASWAEEGRALAGRLRAALSDIALDIDHVGSTAVPGLAAKDVIDLQVCVFEIEPVDPIVKRLATAGFAWVKTIRADTRRVGLFCEAGAADWEKLLFRSPPQTRRVELHVRRHGAANARAALLLRDFLRADAGAREEYGRLKQALAASVKNDFAAYSALKDPAMGLVMRLAECWAERTRWRPGAPDG